MERRYNDGRNYVDYDGIVAVQTLDEEERDLDFTPQACIQEIEVLFRKNITIWI